jgi:hypothetical protein
MHVLVVVDKLSRWIEAWPITNITPNQAIGFITNIIHRFEVSNSIIMYNYTQFTGSIFLEFYDEHRIHVDWVAWLIHVRTDRWNEPMTRPTGPQSSGLHPPQMIRSTMAQRDDYRPLEPKNHLELFN